MSRRAILATLARTAPRPPSQPPERGHSCSRLLLFAFLTAGRNARPPIRLTALGCVICDMRRGISHPSRARARHSPQGEILNPSPLEEGLVYISPRGEGTTPRRGERCSRKRFPDLPTVCDRSGADGAAPSMPPVCCSRPGSVPQARAVYSRPRILRPSSEIICGVQTGSQTIAT